MDTQKEVFLKQKANFIRDEIIRVAVPNKAAHIAPSLSCVDMLTALYYDVMSYNQNNTLWEDRDRLIFSKAHGCYGVYAILADLGVIPKKAWDSFYLEGQSDLWGCMEQDLKYGLEAGCGSLGHGLPMATGLAFGAKIQDKPYYTFCIIGDGELQEGTTWEAMQFAVKYDLNRLIVLVDWNKIQAIDFTAKMLDKKPDDLVRRFEGFGLAPVACPGHDAVKLVETIKAVKSAIDNRPKVIIADTIKGFGLKCMENVPKFHFRLPTEEDLNMGKSYE